jgi:hypothetical protein
VLYSAVVSRRLHDGVHPVPVAFASANASSFTVALADAPHVHVELQGEDVSLFDMCEGMRMEQRSFDQIPDSWEDFISAHRTAPHLSSLRSEGAALEFQECALFVGAHVTLVGELHRGADGALTLRPMHGNGGAGAVPHSRERWLTSWECSGVPPSCVGGEGRGGAVGAGAPEIRIEKVLVSDDPKLLWRFPPLRNWASRACNQEALLDAIQHAALATAGSPPQHLTSRLPRRAC